MYTNILIQNNYQKHKKLLIDNNKLKILYILIGLTCKLIHLLSDIIRILSSLLIKITKLMQIYKYIGNKIKHISKVVIN